MINSPSESASTFSSPDVLFSSAGFSGSAGCVSSLVASSDGFDDSSADSVVSGSTVSFSSSVLSSVSPFVFFSFFPLLLLFSPFKIFEPNPFVGVFAFSDDFSFSSDEASYAKLLIMSHNL